MIESEGAAVISQLERAELAARERRLAAEADAEALLEGARRSAREIDAGVDARMADALAELRRSHLARAETEAAAIEAKLARLDDRAAAEGRRAAVEEAVEHVVAAVLGEIGE